MRRKIKWMLSVGVLLLLLTGCRSVEESKTLTDIEEDAVAYYEDKYGISDAKVEKSQYFLWDIDGLFGAQTTENMYFCMEDGNNVVYLGEEDRFADDRQADEILDAIEEDIWEPALKKLEKRTGALFVKTEDVDFNYLTDTKMSLHYFSTYYDGDPEEFLEQEDIRMERCGVYLYVEPEDDYTKGTEAFCDWVSKNFVLKKGNVFVAVVTEEKEGYLTYYEIGDGEVEKREQDDVFAYDDFEYYTYYSGSSSVNERAVIYVYDGKLILAAQYFDCGDMLMETEKLTAGQEERFWKEIENCKRQEYDGKDEEETEGSSISESYMAMKDGTLYEAEALDWEQIGIDFKDASEVNYPRETGFDIEGLEEVMEAEQREAFPTWVSQEYLAAVEEQLLEHLDEDIVSACVEEMREDDFLLTLETESGANYQAVVTYMGYVSEVTEGKEF